MGVAVFPPSCLTWGQTMGEVMKIMVTSFKRAHAHTATLSAPDPAAGHHQPTPPLESPGHSWACLGQFLVWSLLLSPGSWCTQGFVGALQVFVSPIPCKFCWFLGGVNGDLFQEGLCHTQVCSTQSPWPCGRPLLTRTSTGDTQTQFWLSLWGLGVHSVPFPGLSSSGNQVLGQCTVPGGPCILITSLVLAAPFPGGTPWAPSQACCVSPLESYLRLWLCWWISTIQDLKKTWLAVGSLLTVWCKMPSLGWDGSSLLPSVRYLKDTNIFYQNWDYIN